MSSPLSVVRPLALVAVVCAFTVFATAQSSYLTNELEYAIVGTLAGEQTYPHVSLSATGGYVVWQDNNADGAGLGINARRLNSTLSGEFGNFRVNETAVGEQERPQVAMLSDGGAVIVWQGGRPGFRDIFARFLAPSGVFTTGDIRVNTFTNDDQVAPAVAALTDGNAVVVWTGFGQDGSQSGVYAQRLSSTGAKLGAEFRVNTVTQLSQRSPSVAGLDNGNFAVVWSSDFQNSGVAEFTYTASNPAVVVTSQLFTRLYSAAGTALTSETRVNISTNPVCASPTINGRPGGAYAVAWAQKDMLMRSNNWDIYVRAFTAAGATSGVPACVNTTTYGDQFVPRMAGVGNDQMVVWTSLSQDGSAEGVYGRFLSNSVPVGDEVRVNTTWVSRQMQPAVASDGVSRFLVLWSSFTGLANGFDLAAQRFANSGHPAVPPPAPYVSALGSDRLSVTWAPLAGYSLAHYELYVNAAAPLVLANNYYVLSGLGPATTHNFNLAYRYSDGQLSPLSTTAKGTTWSGDGNFDGLPDSWQEFYWGPNPAAWPGPLVDSDGDGASNSREFLAGTNPRDAASVLSSVLTMTRFGGTLTWNTEPGSIYQVQKSVNFTGWVNEGVPRFAAGTSDSMPVAGLEARAFYRVLRVQ